MTKLYLITGFLGAGKTTFLHQFVRLFPDKRTAIVVNEFGRQGVDGALLEDLDIQMEEINNGSIFCACKIEQFEAALLRLQQEHFDDIFVEASGLSDPTAVGTILSQRDKFPEIEYKGAICLVDGARFMAVYKTARVCRMQLAISDMIIINKCDAATREQIDEIQIIVHAQKPNRPTFETSFGRIEPEWLTAMEEQPTDDTPSGEIHTRDITLRKLLLRVSGLGKKDLTSFLRMFADETYRIKGFVTLPEGRFLVDCVGPMVELRPFEGAPAEEENALVVLFGNGLPAQRAIQEAVGWFPNAEITIEK